MGSYVPTTAAEREQMLSKIGVKSLDDLYAAVPQEMLLRDGLDLPAGLSELEVREKVTGLAEKNKVFKTVLRRRQIPPLHSRRRQVQNLPRGACHLLYAISGRDQPGRAAGDL